MRAKGETRTAITSNQWRDRSKGKFVTSANSFADALSAAGSAHVQSVEDCGARNTCSGKSWTGTIEREHRINNA